MNFEMHGSLSFICKEITNKCAAVGLHVNERFEFEELLKCLNTIEKLLVAKHFCKSTWNIGSLRVLSILQDLRILTASEYILSLQDAETTQLILNDFLEDEFTLITNLFTVAFYDSNDFVKLSAILDECLQRLFTDLCRDANLNDLNYLKTVKSLLPVDLLLKATQKHIGIVLVLHDSKIKDAFPNFTNWINEGVDDIKFTKQLYEQLFCYNACDALAYLFKQSTMEHFKAWKFYLILLQTIASKCDNVITQYLRKYLNMRLRHITAVPTTQAMLHLLLTARAVTATTMDIQKNIDAYADWYKQNVADIKFVLKTEEFQILLKLLEECIDFEMEEAYLEIHAVISISPPVYCGKLVQSYKSKCKIRLTQIRNNVKPLKRDGSIVIEDSN